MKITTGILLAVALLVIMILSGSVYVIDETQQVIITQFGEPVGLPKNRPGLYFKMPFIQNANYFEKRFMEWDGEPNQVPTKDKRFIWVDSYARWRISDPLLFFKRLRDERGAQSRLDDILGGETRNTIARHNLVELVRTTNREPVSEAAQIEAEEETIVLEKVQFGREKIIREILEAASQRSKDLGIELLDLQIKRIDYVEEVRRDVHARMISERRRIAEKYRSEGEGEAARIRGEKDRELKRIESEAYRRAQELQGEADATATQIYASSYSRDPSFYQFLRAVESYPNTIGEDSTLILTTDTEFFRYLQKTK